MKRALLMIGCFALGAASWAGLTAYRNRPARIPTFAEFVKSQDVFDQIDAEAKAKEAHGPWEDYAPVGEQLEALRARVLALEEAAKKR